MVAILSFQVKYLASMQIILLLKLSFSREKTQRSQQMTINNKNNKRYMKHVQIVVVTSRPSGK